MSRRTRKPHPKQVATRKANTWNEKASRKACPLARANVYIQRVNKKACQHEPYTKQTLQVNNNHVNPSWRVHVRQLDTNSWANIVLHILNRQPIPQLNNISFSRRLACSNQRSGKTKKVPKTSQYMKTIKPCKPIMGVLLVQHATLIRTRPTTFLHATA